MPDFARITSAYELAAAALMAERTHEHYWEGELASSALSTATAIFALNLLDERRGTQTNTEFIQQGITWLQQQQNPDGGWGDTVKSLSNISTTMLCRAALKYLFPEKKEPIIAAESWLSNHYGPESQWPEAIRQRYGKDRTFAVPILTMNALAGLIDWKEVPRLPFEAAALPQSWYRFAKLPVVSYALPALIGIGQTIEYHRPTWNPLTKCLRWLCKYRTQRVLRRMQPTSGGYLEATPLTAFVCMSLARIPKLHAAAIEVLREGEFFLQASMRKDGSWPIDSNLSTWVTTLAIQALEPKLEELEASELVDWILKQQQKVKHPFTGAAPGGWGWSHLPGSVPDCDDTPSALLALKMFKCDQQQPIALGIEWLLSLQNRDGGWPTFCKGWGLLPFDRSSNDLSAHAIRALIIWQDEFPTLQSRISVAVEKGFQFLCKQQNNQGAWLPLWFGNQYQTIEENAVYGTAQVLKAFEQAYGTSHPNWQRGARFLWQMQHPSGAWGDDQGKYPSIEETALALTSLATQQQDARFQRGLNWLLEQVENGQFTEPAPIGFYFAKLWYYEKLYPLIYTTAAFARVIHCAKNAEQREAK